MRARREFLRGAASWAGTGLAVAGWPGAWAAMSSPSSASGPGARLRPYRIAVEEHFVLPDLLQAWRKLLASSPPDLDPAFVSLYGKLLTSSAGEQLSERLQSLGPDRLQAMARAGIDQSVLSLTAPGVQLFNPDTAQDWARRANDALAEVVRNQPLRYAGLATFHPLGGMAAVKELARCKRELGLCGALVNSHTQGRYLDEPACEPALAALEELGMPLYLHPQTPSPAMATPYMVNGLEGPAWGFAAETGLHAMRLIFGGVFDRHPRLQVVLGHLGEGLPWWFSRMDSRYQMMQGVKGKAGALKQPPSAYFRTNLFVTTSGMADPARLRFTVDALGADRVLFATDYPYERMDDVARCVDELDLPPEKKALINSGNAAGLFGLTDTPATLMTHPSTPSQTGENR